MSSSEFKSSPDKHFLDTSVARHLMLGSSYYREYLYDQLGTDNLYISPYVLMELNRSFLCKIIDFYFLLNMPIVSTIGDALATWNDKFAGSDIKAVSQLVSNMVNDRRLDLNEMRDKSKALRILADYVWRLELKFRKSFKNTGIDSTRCARALLQIAAKADIEANDIRVFSERFKDIKKCREHCSIDVFLAKRHKNNLVKYIALEKTLPYPSKNENKGFVKIAKCFEPILADDGTSCNCKTCEKIGDSVIALDMPETMRLNTLDHSFDHLCPPIGKVHYKHLSQIAVLKMKATK